MKTYYWSRVPGKFVNMMTGKEYDKTPSFNGTVQDWYNTLSEVVVEALNDMKCENFENAEVLCHTDVHTIFLLLYNTTREINLFKINGKILLKEDKTLNRNEIFVKFKEDASKIEVLDLSFI